MVLGRGFWNARIEAVNKADVAEFRAYLSENPYRPIAIANDLEAYFKTMELAESRFAGGNKYRKICTQIIKRERQIYDENNIAARSNFVRSLQTKTRIGLNELPNLTQEFIFPKLEIRTKEVHIRWIDGNIVATYPPLSQHDIDIERYKLDIGNAATPTDTIIQSYLSALKILIIHPYLDGNGRIARLISTTAITKALNLKYVPFLEPFIRARGNHISATIQSYLETGNATPFLFAFSGAVRDGLELKES